MDDYWLDAARPRLRNWWELGQDPEQTPEYPPIGLEGFKPDQQPAIGFDVQEAASDPVQSFADSWLKEKDARTQPAPVEPEAKQEENPQGFGVPAATPLRMSAFLGPLPAAASTAGAVGGTSAATSLGASALLAAPLVAIAMGSDGQSIDLGNGRRLAWLKGDPRFTVQKGDGGILSTGFLENWKETGESARDVLRTHPSIDFDTIRRTFGDEGAALALQTLLTFETGAQKKGESSEPSRRDDYFSRKILALFPDLIQRDTDHWAKEGVEQTEAEREHEDACRKMQWRPGEEVPDGKYSGDDGRDTPFGKMPPDIVPPAAQKRPENPNHEKGVVGEAEMALRLYNLGTHRIFHFANPPGVHGPDGMAMSDKFRDMMFLESKYSTNLRGVGGSQANLSTPDRDLVNEKLQAAVDSGHMPEDLARDARESLRLGNYSSCTGGTGNAYNGYFISFRNGKPVMVKRIR